MSMEFLAGGLNLNEEKEPKEGLANPNASRAW